MELPKYTVTGHHLICGTILCFEQTVEICASLYCDGRALEQRVHTCQKQQHEARLPAILSRLTRETSKQQLTGTAKIDATHYRCSHEVQRYTPRQLKRVRRLDCQHRSERATGHAIMDTVINEKIPAFTTLAIMLYLLY